MSSVHELACEFYSKAQLEAWAPLAYDVQLWAERITAFLRHGFSIVKRQSVMLSGVSINNVFMRKLLLAGT